jgi:hypothetical protein
LKYSCSALLVTQLLEAGSDPKLTNKDGLKPVDLLRSSSSEDKVRRKLREAEAVSAFRSTDVVGEIGSEGIDAMHIADHSVADEDEESDGGTPSEEE